MNIDYRNLYYTVIKNRDDKEILENKYESNENDYFVFNDSINPDHFIGRKNIDVKLRWRKLRSYINHFNKFLLQN